MSTPSIKRQHVFINKAFQGKFILGVFALILLSGLGSALLIYWLTGNDLQAQSQSAHISIMTAFDRLGLSIFIGNVVAILLAGVVSIFSVIYATHKIAGPLYRFEKICEAVGNGQLDTITTLRENDQLKQLASAFSVMVEKLRAQRFEQNTQINLAKEQIAALKQDSELTENQTKLLERLEQTIKKLA